jgi:hypothetical protein
LRILIVHERDVVARSPRARYIRIKQLHIVATGMCHRSGAALSRFLQPMARLRIQRGLDSFQRTTRVGNAPVHHGPRSPHCQPGAGKEDERHAPEPNLCHNQPAGHHTVLAQEFQHHSATCQPHVQRNLPHPDASHLQLVERKLFHGLEQEALRLCNHPTTHQLRALRSFKYTNADQSIDKASISERSISPST